MDLLATYVSLFFYFYSLVAAQYNGTLCSDYVDYEVWLPPGFTVASIEAALASQNVTMAAIGQVPIACFPPLAETLCSSTFPRVVPIVGQRRFSLFA